MRKKIQMCLKYFFFLKDSFIYERESVYAHTHTHGTTVR